MKQVNLIARIAERLRGADKPGRIIRHDGAAISAGGLAEEAAVQAASIGAMGGRPATIVSEDPVDILRSVLAVALADGRPMVVSARRPGETTDAAAARRGRAAALVDAPVGLVHGRLERPATRIPWSTPSTAADECAFLQMSSGSLGPPRPLRISGHALGGQLDVVSAVWGVNHSSTVGSWLPLSHDFGLIGAALAALHNQADLVLWTPEEFIAAPAAWVTALREHRVAYTPTIPVGMHLMSRSARGGLPDLCTVPVGADMVRAPVLERFEAAFDLRPGVVRVAYGLADATLLVTTTSRGGAWRTAAPPEPSNLASIRFAPTSAPVSVGEPVPGQQVWIEGTEGPLPLGSVGDVAVRSSTRSSGVFGDADVPEPDAPLRTGDVGYFDGAELVILGRSAEVVRVAGEDFLPADVEESLCEDAAVRRGRVAVVGVDDDASTRMVAVVEQVNATPLDRRRLLDRCRTKGVPLSEVRFVPPGWLPKTTSGKLQRKLTAQRLAASDTEPGGRL